MKETTMSEFPGYMRATVFAPKRASFPAYVQPKHNGIRCITDGVTAWTREGNLHADHIQRLIGSLPQAPRGCWSDGELVLPKERFSFQQTQSAVAAENENSHLLEYKVFDIYRPAFFGETFSERKGQGVTCATYKVTDMIGVEYWYERFLDEGYEGLIFRMDTPYKLGSAGRYLMKYKPKDDAEFRCIGIVENTGKAAGTPTFRLLRPDVDYTAGTPADKKNSFGATPKGDYDKKRELWEKYKDGSCIGKWYKVEFADRYDSGVPQFPVGLGFRDVDGPGYEETK
jgi:ATP-dependent DNA ligase